MTMHTRHFGILAIAGIEIGKALGTVCGDPSMVEGLANGDIAQLATLVFVIVDYIKARRSKVDTELVH